MLLSKNHILCSLCCNIGSIEQAEKNMQDVVDESIMDDLQGEDAANWMTTSKRQKQAEEKLRQRIKAEQKAENVRKSSGKGIEVDEDDDDDDTAMLTFAKGGRDTKTKKK